MKIQISEKERYYFINSCFKRHEKENTEFENLINIMREEKLIKNFKRKTGIGKGNIGIKLTKRGKMFVIALSEPCNNEDEK